MILQKLWGRGEPGDARSIELIREANPDTPVPAFLVSVEGTTLHAWRSPEVAEESAAMLVGEYWNDVFTRDELVRADWRRRGVGQGLMRLLLEHPTVRGARVVRQSLNARFGFVPNASLPPRPYATTEMLLRRR